MQYNLGGEIHVARSQRTLCSHTRGGEEGWCVRLDAENDMLLFTSRHAENDMLKTGRFLAVEENPILAPCNFTTAATAMHRSCRMQCNLGGGEYM